MSFPIAGFEGSSFTKKEVKPNYVGCCETMFFTVALSLEAAERK
jgi:hypothetical protein